MAAPQSVLHPHSGKVTLVTNLGHVEVRLWSAGAPEGCRNFVQNCMDQFYDDSPFHKIVKGESVSTGLRNGESNFKIARETKNDKIGYKTRGIVALKGDATGHCTSELIITLGETTFYDKQHTIIGQIVAQTFYPILNIGETQVDTDFKPYEPPVIKHIIIDENPFHDMNARALYGLEEKSKSDTAKAPKKKRKREATKNKALMSCADEMDELDAGFDKADGVVSVFGKGSRVISAHDMIEGNGLEKESKVTDARRKEIQKQQRQFEQTHGQQDDARTQRLKAKISGKRNLEADAEFDNNYDDDVPDLPNEQPERTDAETAEMERLKKEKESMQKSLLRQRGNSGQDGTEDDGKPKTKGFMILEEMRAKFKRQKAGLNREKEMILKLNAFGKKLKKTVKETQPVKDENEGLADLTPLQKEEAYLKEEAEEKDGWMKGSLVFANPNAKLDGSLVDDTYDVVDPLTLGGLDQSSKAAAKRARAAEHELTRKSHRVPDGYVPPDMRNK
eukprot:TRINITY_DN953_c4_g1_i1.p1 TRINITY_DN953_c4_g1~~TRINITY_DN953_c4_g1_i1.p1  ORF type:complete len:521 (+),score=113.66 TRINITY_DN953_c4_g1_i1:51-1565(+)